VTGVNTTVDKKLIHAAQRGSPKAFHLLVRGFDWPVLRLALRITGTEQAAQAIYLETMLSMHARLAAFQCECSLYLCAYSIVAQLCLDYLCGDRGRAVQATASGKSASVLNSLSPRERLVFELRHYQGLDLSTVSQVLNITEELARNVLLRACHKLGGASRAVVSNKS
jgi:RNA polymerase sigma-70 factor, ECF subfamily